MTVEPAIAVRLQFLARVVRKECRHLATTDQRLFASAFTLAQAGQLEADLDLAERVEAFVGRFGRLQDTVRNAGYPHCVPLSRKRGRAGWGNGHGGSDVS